MEKATKSINWEQFFCTPQNSISTERAEFSGDRMLYVVTKGRWCNVRASREKKSDDSKFSLYEESEQVFDHFRKDHRKILFGDFNTKLGRGYFQTDNWEWRVYIRIVGAWGSIVVKAPRYKSVGPGIDSKR